MQSLFSEKYLHLGSVLNWFKRKSAGESESADLQSGQPSTSSTNSQIPDEIMTESRRRTKLDGHVIFSYDSDDTAEIARKVCNGLREANIPVWFDKDDLRGNIYETLAHAVANAFVMLIFVSSGYERNETRKREALFAGELKKRIIPVFTVKSYKGPGQRSWLGLLISGCKRQDFRKGSYENNFKRLLEAINKDDTEGAGSSEVDPPSDDGGEDCKELQEVLKEAVQYASEREESTILGEKKIDRVLLELVTGNNSQHLVKGSNQFCAREDFEKMYGVPKGNMKLEELLQCAVKHAEKEASYCTHNDLARNHYVQLHGNVIGVVGEAGSGKTAFSKMLAEKLVSGSLGRFKYVFYINLRKVKFNVKTTFLQFIGEGISLESLSGMWSEEAAKEILKVLNNSAEVVFILDGLDEAAVSDLYGRSNRVNIHEKATAESFLKNLLNGGILTQAKKIIVSRPRHLYELNESCRPHFISRVLGLSKEAQLAICRQICGDHAAQVIQFLKDNPDILLYCYVPATCILTMIAIHKGLTTPDMKHNLGTITGIMTFVLKEFAKSAHLRSNSETKEKELEKICKLAWHGFFDNVPVFRKYEVDQFGIDEEVLDAFLCNYVEVTSRSKILAGAKQLYFSHVLWQEFFSAIYVILFMPPVEFWKHREKFSDNKWQKVSQFMFGFNNTETYQQLQSIFRISGETASVAEKKDALRAFALESASNRIEVRDETKQLLRLCVLVHEAGDESLRNRIAEALPRNVILRGSLLPSDMNSLFYLFSGRSSKLNISLEVTFVEESFKIFFRKMAACNHRRNIQMPKVACHELKIDNESAQLLAACLNQIQELFLRKCRLSTSGVESITRAIGHLEEQLELLDFSGSPIGDIGAICLSSCLENINQLCISDCNITDAGHARLNAAFMELSQAETSGEEQD